MNGKVKDILGVRVAVDDTAHVYVSLHLEVAVVSPCGAPGVLDDPVVHTVHSSIADCKHCVIDVTCSVLTEGSRVDTRFVIPEPIDYLEGYRYGADLEESESERVLTQGDVDCTSDDSYNLSSWDKLARLIYCDIGILVFSCQST